MRVKQARWHINHAGTQARWHAGTDGTRFSKLYQIYYMLFFDISRS